MTRMARWKRELGRCIAVLATCLCGGRALAQGSTPMIDVGGSVDASDSTQCMVCLVPIESQQIIALGPTRLDTLLDATGHLRPIGFANVVALIAIQPASRRGLASITAGIPLGGDSILIPIGAEKLRTVDGQTVELVGGAADGVRLHVVGVVLLSGPPHALRQVEGERLTEMVRNIHAGNPGFFIDPSRAMPAETMHSPSLVQGQFDGIPNINGPMARWGIKLPLRFFR